MHEKILIVEDNALDRKILSTLLEKRNYVPLESEDAFSALDRIEHNKVDLILLDINLPKLSGFNLLKRLGNYSLRNSVPIIMMSATRLDKNGIMQSIKYGASDFIVKPVHEETLFEKIEKLKSDEKMRKQIKVQIPENNTTSIELQGEINSLEESGLTFVSNYPLNKGQVLVLNNSFLKGLGIENLRLVAKAFEEVEENFHHFLSYEICQEVKREKIQAVYRSLAENSQKQIQQNFGGE